MADEPRPVEVLEAQMTAISDTHTNLVGLIEKTAGIQAELGSAGFQDFADGVGEPFSAMTMASEALQKILHAVELERNRIRNEE
jgi:hypothetical protein